MINEESNEQRMYGNSEEYRLKMNNQTENLSEFIQKRKNMEISEGMQKYMPIGSIVTLNGSDKLTMIIGFNYLNNQTTYDYIGCQYPFGVTRDNATYLFNHNQIDKIYHVGYINGQERQFKEQLITVEKPLSK